MTVTLMRFKVKDGQEARVNEWFAFLNDHMEATLLTLDAERMYVETIHRERVDGQTYLYWYTIQGDGGRKVSESDDAIDIKHRAYWQACIDPSYTPMVLSSDVVMIPKRVRAAMTASGVSGDETSRA